MSAVLRIYQKNIRLIGGSLPKKLLIVYVFIEINCGLNDSCKPKTNDKDYPKIQTKVRKIDLAKEESFCEF